MMMMMMMRRKTQSVKFPYLNIMLHTDLSQVLLEFTDIYDFNAMSSPFEVRCLLSHGGSRVIHWYSANAKHVSRDH